MKKLYPLLLCCFGGLSLYGQSNDRAITAPRHPKQEIKTYTPQQELDLAKQAQKDVVPISSVFNNAFALSDAQNPSLSAEAANTVRFKDIPVNLATGAMSVPLPLYTLNEGMLSVPISIDYNGSGMKNQEVASWCGAGWNLTAGGSITRMVRGIPDEGLKNGSTNLRGYFKFGFGGDGTSVDNDTEPDVFYLNLHGASYKVMYRYDGDNAKFEFFPDADIKFIPTFSFLAGNSTVGIFEKFEVVMPDGVHYFFGNGAIESTAEAEAGFIQSSGNYPGTTGFTNFWQNNAQTSVWHLTKIVSPYGQEINFDYDQVRYSYYRINDTGVDGNLGVCPTPSQVEKSINRVFVKTVSLAKISGINTRIELNQRYRVCSTQYDPSSGEYTENCEYQDLSNPRIDIDQWQRYPQNQSNAKRLNEIMVLENVAIPKDTLIYKFHYGHFFGVTNDLPTGYSENNTGVTLVGYSHQRRLRLEKIDFPDQTNVRFRYKGDALNYNGKSRLDYGIDHWGYANGSTGNRSLTGLIPKDNDYPTCTAATSNRETDPAFGFYGSMDSVVYSNRRTIAFAYEIHTANNYKNADGSLRPIGGCRIKSIVSKDLISGIETKKVYEYSLNGKTTGHLALKPTYRYKTPFNEIGSHSSIYDRLLGEMGRPPLVYSRVKEKLLNSSNQGLGSTVYYFDNDTTDLNTLDYYINCTGTYPNQVCDTTFYLRPERVHPSSINGKWDHKYQTGSLIKMETFNESGDTLAIQSWEYSTTPIWNNYLKSSAAKLFRVNNKTLGIWNYNSQSNTANFHQQYEHWFTKYRLESQTSKTFSQMGTSPVVSTVNYVYKDEMALSYQQKYLGKHNQLVQTETIDSRGKTTKSLIKYPADFEFLDDTLHYEVTCYDEYGAYDCSYDIFVPHVPVVGSQARGIFEFKDFHLWAFPIETSADINGGLIGAKYTTIEAFNKPSGGFNYAPKKAFSSGSIGSSFFEMDYQRTPNDTIYRQQTYYQNHSILEYNAFGLPQKNKPFAGVESAITYDASGILAINQRHNLGGVITDSTTYTYSKKLYGVSKIVGSNHLENHTVYDTLFKKGLVKQTFDKDQNILGQYDYLEPYENSVGLGLTTDNTKIRSVVRVPRIGSTTLPSQSDDVSVSLTYSDTDGRTLQSKRIQGSPNKKDMVGGFPIFDSFGRPQKSILPVPTTNANGAFEPNTLTAAQSFYNDTAPFAEITQYEASPLSRSFKSIGAGVAFRPNKEGVQSFETGSFGINKLEVNGSSLYISAYTGNQLLKTTTTDEQGNKSISFSDKEGKLLESWVQVSGDGSLASHYLKTTYVYDVLNRQTVVIPPLLYGQIPNGTDLSTSVYSDFIYYIIYDSRGRVTETHVPDGGWAYVVYNRLGQVVLSQNARQRETALWEWTKYGARGQAVMSGTLINYTYGLTTLQQLFDNFTEEKQFEEFLISGTEKYTSRSFPSQIQTLITSNGSIKTVNYFDDYAWNTNASLHFAKYKTDRWQNAKGLLTGQKVKRLDTDQWLATAFYYDDKNRVIQTQSENRFGSVNQTDVVMDFIGQVLQERTIYRKPNQADITVGSAYTYDHAGRTLEATHQLNGKNELLASYEYDEIGRLVKKNLNEARAESIVRQSPVETPHQNDYAKRYILLQPGTCISGDSVYSGQIAAGLQNVAYSYDIRGNLRCINCKTNGNLDSSKVFALKLDYFQDGRLYNGLLSKQTWYSPSDNTARNYVYDYDKANRLIKGDYTGKSPENFSVPQITYDANGNVAALQRYGETTTNNFGLIDDLQYSYPANSNKLTTIDDNAIASKGFKNVSGSPDYTYYADGFQKTDANKGITNITYNYLGLIERVDFGAIKRIENTYTADGQKLRTKFIDGATTLTKDYVGDLIYINDTLRSVWHDEGRVTFDNSQAPTYQYFISDHLGSTRVVFQKLNNNIYVAQRIDYGVTGDIITSNGTGQNLLTHLFQGKEWLDGFGYDFVSRTYDPYTMRFLQIDGANQFASGYTGMGNMPTMGVDPDGQFVWFVWAGAAAIGGASNLYSNWSKVKDWKSGLAYFGSGAIGGAVSLTGAGFWGGTATTATLNVGIDVATGNLPNLKSFGDYAEYGLFTGLSGMSGGGAGSISKFAFGGGIRNFFTWMQKPYFNPQPGFAAIKNNATGVLEKVSWAAEAGVQSTKVPLSGLAANAAKQGLSKAANLNTNAAKGNFGIYEILKDGQLYKYGKADLGRVTQTSGLPTRLHQQVRQLQGQFKGNEVFGRVIEDLGSVSTKSAKGVENAYLNFFYKTTGKIPVGNSKSFFPR